MIEGAVASASVTFSLKITFYYFQLAHSEFLTSYLLNTQSHYLPLTYTSRAPPTALVDFDFCPQSPTWRGCAHYAPRHRLGRCVVLVVLVHSMSYVCVSLSEGLNSDNNIINNYFNHIIIIIIHLYNCFFTTFAIIRKVFCCLLVWLCNCFFIISTQGERKKLALF